MALYDIQTASEQMTQFIQHWIDRNGMIGIAQCFQDMAADSLVCRVTTNTHTYGVAQFPRYFLENESRVTVMQRLTTELEQVFGLSSVPSPEPKFTLEQLNEAQDFIDKCGQF